MIRFEPTISATLSADPRPFWMVRIGASGPAICSAALAAAATPSSLVAMMTRSAP
jgi:hypothetical protein